MLKLFYQVLLVKETITCPALDKRGNKFIYQEIP